MQAGKIYSTERRKGPAILRQMHDRAIERVQPRSFVASEGIFAPEGLKRGGHRAKAVRQTAGTLR